MSPSGRPQVTPLWIDHDGGDLLINTATGRLKARNMEHDPHVAVSIVDPADNYRVIALQGHVVQTTTEGADDHIDRLAKKYLGVDAYPARRPDETRVTIRIRPDRIIRQPGPPPGT